MSLATSNFDPIAAAIAIGGGALVLAFLGLRHLLTERRKPTIRQVFLRFFGPDLGRLETHDKYFPGYDLASVNRALSSFREDCCTAFREVGATLPHLTGMRMLLDTIQTPQFRNLEPTALTYQRVPVDIHEEASFPSSGIFLAEVRSEAGGDRIAILLSAHWTRDSHNGMDTQNAPRQQIAVSIACRSRAVADRFFTELEERRRRLCVYRGKVIDPVVGPAGIFTIGFRAIHKVREEDLILPTSVKDLVRRAVLGFCEHADVLRRLGIDLKRGVLFHGPPGTGKTSLSLYLAGRLPQFTVCFISGERLLYPREICRMGRYLQPAMIVFEDIDLVALERNANGLATVLGELMNQIDGCEPTDQVLFVMNTNSLERLEHAVKDRPGRVDQIIAIPLPGRAERRQLLGHFARGARVAVDDWDRVLLATEGMTPAMLKEIVKRAAVNAIERNGHGGRADALTIEESDLLLAAEQVPALREPERVPGALGFREEKR
ncbi:MAG TPA: AAA family ATPase [Gemmataceae bacterium]|nr:AAA family ATPase [Gemmataceae bacterium]